MLPLQPSTLVNVAARGRQDSYQSVTHNAGVEEANPLSTLQSAVGAFVASNAESLIGGGGGDTSNATGGAQTGIRAEVVVASDIQDTDVSELWNPGPISLDEGASGLPAGQFNVAATGPNGYVGGGQYEVDPATAQLPTGMTLTEAGLLDVGPVLESTTPGVTFAYTEPNAYQILTLIPQKTGTFAIRATVFPTKGTLPTGRFFVSPDDSNLRSSTLSTWPDGSARVVVVASCGVAVTAGVNKTINLRPNKASDSAGTDLTVARIGALISNITFNFGSPVSITDFSNPDWVWWKNSQVICARYRVPIGLGNVEAVLDIHAFKNHAVGGDYALVECLMENSTINASSPSITTPATQTYSGTITVNGVQMASHTTPAPGLEIEGYNTRRTLHHVQTQPTSGPYTVIHQYPYQTPPSISAGQAVLVDNGGNGAFAGQAGKIAQWNGSSWTFVGSGTGTVGAPAGWIGDVRKEDKVIWNGYWWAGGMSGGHESGRAWWSSAWVHGATVSAEYDPANPGAANPGIEITHNIASMQAHPLFFKQAVPASANLVNKQTRYGEAYFYQPPFDKYVPYYMGRWRTDTMNDGGDDEGIGLYMENQADYILSANKLIQRTVIADGFAWTGFAEHWRDVNSHQPPIPSQISTKSNWNGTWPYHWSSPAWGGSQHESRAYTDSTHVPSMAIVQFLCRPSPYFIEQAQHFLAWWWQNTSNGQVRNEAARARGWGTRNLAYASFLTPDNLYTAAGATISQASRKAEYGQALVNAALGVLRYRDVQTTPPNTLQFMYGYEVNDNGTVDTSEGFTSWPGYQDASWMHYIAMQCFHMVDSCELLTGSGATTFKDATDWIAAMPVRRVMECDAAGNKSWLMVLHHEAVGTDDANHKLVSSQSNWNSMIQQYMAGTPPAVGGPWVTWDDPTNWQDTTSSGYDLITVAAPGYIQYNYQDWFLTALSCAVERDAPNASAAWDIVAANACLGSGGLTNYVTGYDMYTRFNRWPRNK